MSEESPKTTPIQVQEIRPEDKGRIHDPQLAETMAHAAAPHMDAFRNEYGYSPGRYNSYDELEHKDKVSKVMNHAASEAGYTNEDVGHSTDAEKDHEIASEMNKHMPDFEDKEHIKQLESSSEPEQNSIFERYDREYPSDAKRKYESQRKEANKAGSRVRHVQELREVMGGVNFDKIARFIPTDLQTHDEFVTERVRKSTKSKRQEYIENKKDEFLRDINVELDYMKYVLKSEQEANLIESKIKTAFAAIGFDKDIDELSNEQIRGFLGAVVPESGEKAK